MGKYVQIITTWVDAEYMNAKRRIDTIIDCRDSVATLLKPQPDVALFCDDGSPVWWGAMEPTSRELMIPRESGDHSAGGVGASLNRGIYYAKRQGYDLFLYAVDDWQVQMPLDISKPLAYMAADPSISAIRLGLPHPDLTGTIKHTDFGWYIDLDPHHYVVSHRPTLWRVGFFESLGPWKEGVSAVECEADMNERWIRDARFFGRDGARWRMLYWLPTTFDHIEGDSLSEIDPKRR